MNITTHGIVAFVLGIVIFRNVELAIIVLIGAVIPDLDREYGFFTRDTYRAWQLHRALFHNFWVAAILWIMNPLLALGALSHYFLDVFTSATDRGIEFLFPLTRVVGAWLYGIEGETTNGEKAFKYAVRKDEKDTAKKLQWWVEDPWPLLYKTSEFDLSEPTPQPWRRSYGPFRNSKIVDWGIFTGSVLFLLLLFVPASSRATFYSFAGLNLQALWFILAFGGIALYFGLGEWLRKSTMPQFKVANWPVSSALVVALICFVIGGFFAGVFSVHWPSCLTIDLLAAGIGSIFLGLIIAYGCKKLRESEDLSL
ncbi:MAG: metal-dependent hydrolase [Halobacteriota archaeon]